jgi:hypothetical protein
MYLKDIISTLMLSDFYFSLPLWERKQVVFRLWALYGAKLPPSSDWHHSLEGNSQGIGVNLPKG